jgi:hypothetical protein
VQKQMGETTGQVWVIQYYGEVIDVFPGETDIMKEAQKLMQNTIDWQLEMDLEDILGWCKIGSESLDFEIEAKRFFVNKGNILDPKYD